MAQSGKLTKELSLFGVYALATGATLSSGFFLLPGLAVTTAGPAVFISYLISVVPLIPGIMSKIELATAMPRAGGEYYFIDRSLGPLCGTIAGLGTWCGLVLKTAFALIGIAAYTEVFFPQLPIKPLVAGVAVLFGILNLCGARTSGRMQALLVLGLLPLLLWFITLGAVRSDLSHFNNLWATGFDQIIGTAGLVCVSFMGLTKVASVAEEIKDPERNLPRGIFLAAATAMVVYGVGTFALVGLIPADQLAGRLAPVADAAEVLIGSTGAKVMTVAAILAFLSVGNAGILSASRYPLAMSRDHLLPSWFRHLNRYQTPANAIYVTTAAILVFILVLDPTGIAKLASTFLLLLFAFNCLAVMVMRESRIESYDPGFRSPWYPWMQIIGIIGPLVFIIMMGWLPVLFAAGVVVAGTAWYLYYARSRIARGGAIYHLFARWGQHRFEGLDRELRGILKEKGLRAEDPYDEVVARAAVIDGPTDQTFEAFVRKASAHLAVHLPLEPDALFKAFMEGTRIGATPVSKGVALPHLRLAELATPLMVLARSQPGVRVDVDFELVKDSADQKIHAIIFLASSEDNPAQHLRLLAQVAQQVERDDFMNDWLAAADQDQLLATLQRAEHFLSLQLHSGTATETWIAHTVRELDLPDDTLIAMLQRHGQVLFPRGGTRLREGDRLTLVGPVTSIAALRERYAT